jgi:hypothetical protein|tara:strand:- start:139 stop:552 length:414 start_codon:yes stop_codon:yes gene_type:complete
MLVDAHLLVSDEQDLGLSAGSGSELSDNSIDMKAARKSWGGRQVYMIVIVDETFAGGTSVRIEQVTDTVEALSSATVKGATPVILTASLTAGRAPIVIPVAGSLGTEEQFLGLNYVVVGTFTAGKLTAFLAIDPVTL